MKTGTPTFLLKTLVFLILPAFQLNATIPPLVLSEIMSDPVSVSDAHGEFIEFANTTADTLRIHALDIVIDEINLSLPSVQIGPGQFFMVCRDSLPVDNGRLICNRQLPALSLANGRMLSVRIGANDLVTHYSIGPSSPGISWENTFDVEREAQSFKPSLGWGGTGELFTPGNRNSQSALPLKSDLGIDQVTLNSEGVVEVQVLNYGSIFPSHPFLTLRLDDSWNGRFERQLDSLELAPFEGQGSIFRIPVEKGLQGLIRVELTWDENPQNNFKVIPLEMDTSLVMSEWCPTPKNGAPEWIEIHNRSLEIGGQGRTLDLSQVAVNGRLLGPKAGELAPGEFLIVTESESRFRVQFGAMKIRILEIANWPSLRNIGDTLTLSIAGFPLENLIYSTHDLASGQSCLSPGKSGFVSGMGSPGFIPKSLDEFSWVVSGRVVGAGTFLNGEVKGQSGLVYSIQIFDIDGNCVRSMAQGLSGPSKFEWRGEDDHGQMLPVGPYVLCLRSGGHRTKKWAMALQGP